MVILGGYLSDGEYFTDLHCEADGAIFTDIQHPYVNLAGMFTGALKGEVNFHSRLALRIHCRFLGEGELT